MNWDMNDFLGLGIAILINVIVFLSIHLLEKKREKDKNKKPNGIKRFRYRYEMILLKKGRKKATLLAWFFWCTSIEKLIKSWGKQCPICRYTNFINETPLTAACCVCILGRLQCDDLCHKFTFLKKKDPNRLVIYLAIRNKIIDEIKILESQKRDGFKNI